MSRTLLSVAVLCVLASPVVTAEAPQAAPKDKEAKGELEPHFRIELADNQTVDLDTWRTAKGGEQTSEAFDVGWDNDGGGAFMRNPKGPARILPLPSAGGFKEALAQAVKQLDKLKESASRGALASEARRFAVLTDQGRLAVVEVTEATPAKGRICWSLFQVKPREGGPPEVTPLRHLPPAKGREEPSVLDLASGQALPCSDEAARDGGVFTRMGKGDLLYEDDLYCLRGAKAQSLEGDAFPRVKVEADTTLYKLPKVPCRLRITTAEKKQFDVTILAVTQDKGIDLEYRPAEPPVAPQPQGAGSPATGAGALGEIWISSHSSTMNIFGGHADFVHANNLSTLNVSGGTFGSFWAHDSSTVTVCGGSLPVWAEQDSRAEISGGTILFIKAGDAGGSHHSVVTISGTGFNYPYGEIPDMSGTLTGVLANGDPINASFEIYDNASIVLVPEQAALVLLSIGAAGLVSWARVRRSRPRCTGTVCVSVPRSLAALVAGALVLGLAGPLQAGWFLTWLDPLPGDDSGLPYAVSADGSTIVGQSSRGAYHSDYRPEAFRWTPSGGMAGLGFLPGHAWSEAHGVSADGSVVVGYSQAAIGEHMHAGGEAFRWTEDTGPVGLGHLQGDDLSWAYGVSADGSVVVGYSGNMGWNDTAFVWTRQGKMTALPLPAGGAWSRAMAVSATGSVVAGEWGTDNSHEGAFRWTADLGSVGLNSLPGGGMDYVCGLSADGSVIVGEGSDGRAARWTETEGLLYLVSPAQDPDHSAATAVSDDGSFIVGYGHSVTPFLWDAAHGARDLRQLLVADGVELGQGFLLTARDVSFDGQTIVIVGEGVDPNGAGLKVWMARALIPEPSTAALVSLAAVGLAARFGRERKKPQGSDREAIRYRQRQV